MEKRKRGRPPDELDARTVTVRFRVTPDERDLLHEAGDQEGGLSEVVRYAAIHEACSVLGYDVDEYLWTGARVKKA